MNFWDEVANDLANCLTSIFTVRAFLNETVANLPSATIESTATTADLDAWAILRHFASYGTTGIGQVRIRLVSDSDRFRDGVYLNLG